MRESNEYEELKSRLLNKGKRKQVAPTKGLSTGSTLLNLCCSGEPGWGFAKGTYVFLVGDSASGKTFLSLTCLAEAAKCRDFDNYRFLYDGAEGGAMMDIAKFFGEDVAKRLEFPGDPRQLQGVSTTVEEFFWNLDDTFDDGKPFIYILDSMDSLTTGDEDGKFTEAKQASRNGKQVAGSYGTSKAKLNSANIRRIIPQLRQTGSILIVISQTRDNLGFGFEKKTRSGGHALRFYAHLEIWSSVKGKIRKTVQGKDRQLGITCLAQVKKNRLTGRERSVEIPIYHSLGIDDVGSMVNWLVEEGHWGKAKASIDAKEFSFRGTPEKLVEKVETEGREGELRRLVAYVWDGIEAACEVKRKKRYD